MTHNDDKLAASVLGCLVGMAILDKLIQKDTSWLNEVEDEFKMIEMRINEVRHGSL